MRKLLAWLWVFMLLYFFLASISLMGTAFKLFGKGLAHQLLQMTANPFVGLFIGLLATSLIQSSSTTTSITVGMVSAGVIPLAQAIPIIMGANIGTSVTNTLVSLAHINRKEEFERAFAGAIIHDFFNILTTAILLPLELTTHYLYHLSSWFAHLFHGKGGGEFESPIKASVKPLTHGLKDLFLQVLHFPKPWASAILLILSLLGIFFCLTFLVRTMRGLLMAQVETIFHKVICRTDITALFAGIIITVMVQSSSITTSLLVPVLAAGIITLEQAFPITLGANIGTTITALLAALVGTVDGLAIALAHLFFNITGILIIYPVKKIRKIPINLARRLARRSITSKKVVAIYIFTVFYGIPITLILISRLF